MEVSARYGNALCAVELRILLTNQIEPSVLHRFRQDRRFDILAAALRLLLSFSPNAMLVVVYCLRRIGVQADPLHPATPSECARVSAPTARSDGCPFIPRAIKIDGAHAVYL
jgi:hypothetical protein